MSIFDNWTQKQKQSLATVGGVLQLAAALASPRWLARGSEDDWKQMTKERVLGLFDDYLRMSNEGKVDQVPDPGKPCAPTEEPARRMRALLATWEFGPVAPEPLVRAARDYLTEMGISHSDERWDQLEKPEAEDGTAGLSSMGGRSSQSSPSRPSPEEDTTSQSSPSQVKKPLQGEYLRVIDGALAIAEALSAPRLLAQIPPDEREEITQEGVLELFDSYIRLVVNDKEEFQPRDDQPKCGIEEPLRRMRALLATWEWGPAAPKPLVRAARDMMKFHIKWSDKEWDRYATRRWCRYLPDVLLHSLRRPPSP